MNTNPYRLAGWSAILSAIATFLGFVTIIGFFMVGGLFGVINDAISVIGSLAIIPILFALYQLLRSHASAASLGALVIGIIAMLVAAILQALLVFKVITYEQTAVPVPFAYGVVGLSLIAFNAFAYTHKSFSRKLAIWGIVAGAGYVLTIMGFIIGGQNHPLTYIGGLAAVIAYIVWAFWLGRIWLRNTKGESQ
ncbi:MAG: hypothetical protein FJZ87_05780 [Chloroflexi bacterium]|nr:hypothetical protein [Chloroflexota bacterium]